MTVTRRNLMAAGVATASLIFLESHGSPARARAANGPTHAVVEAFGTTGTAFTSDFLATVPFGVLLGASLTGDKGAFSSARLSVIFDARVQKWNGNDVVLQSGSTSERIPVELTTAGSTHTLTFGLPSASVATKLVLALPLDQVILYPNENIGLIPAPTVQLIPAVESIAPITVALESTVPSVSGTAWGAQTTATWTRVEAVSGTGGDAYSYPDTIEVASIGPGPIPQGSRVAIIVDGNIAVSITPVDAALPEEPPRARHFELAAIPAQVGGTIVLDEPVPAGEIIRVRVQTQLHEVTRVGDGVTYGRATFAPAADFAATQRRTGQESAVAVSGSGVPLIPDAVRSKN
ncbi:hypothetical protein ABIE21_003277 [Conyzicola nivalis]|uniref:Uncharacterized protein n=1 Tax=Conyzicola nivalis TaxID=1477021 RepID=A0ABV2QRN5_9MICO